MRLLGIVFFVALSWVLFAIAFIGLATLASLVGWLGTLLCLAFFGLFAAIAYGVLVEEPEVRFVSHDVYDQDWDEL